MGSPSRPPDSESAHCPFDRTRGQPLLARMARPRGGPAARPPAWARQRWRRQAIQRFGGSTWALLLKHVFGYPNAGLGTLRQLRHDKSKIRHNPPATYATGAVVG